VEKKEAMMSPANNCVTKDEAEAVNWYRRAAEQGNAYAQSNLGFMYSMATVFPRTKQRPTCGICWQVRRETRSRARRGTR
jgi:TPR repeat protein